MQKKASEAVRTISQTLSYSHQKKTFKQNSLEVSSYHRALRKSQTGPEMIHLICYSLKSENKTFEKRSFFSEIS